MTDQEIIIEVAKLDGWIYHPAQDVYQKEFSDRTRHVSTPLVEKHLGSYLTSRDAIIPVIEKQGLGIKYTLGWKLSEELNFDEESLSDVDNLGYRFTDILCATPRQLCIALLKASGNWKEQP